MKKTPKKMATPITVRSKKMKTLAAKQKATKVAKAKVKTKNMKDPSKMSDNKKLALLKSMSINAGRKASKVKKRIAKPTAPSPVKRTGSRYS